MNAGDSEESTESARQQCYEQLERNVQTGAKRAALAVLSPFIPAMFLAILTLLIRGMFMFPFSTGLAAIGHFLTIGFVVTYMLNNDSEELETPDRGEFPEHIREAAAWLEQTEPRLDKIILQKYSEGVAEIDMSSSSCVIRVNPDEIHGETPLTAYSVLAHEVGHYLQHRYLIHTSKALVLPAVFGTPLLSLHVSIVGVVLSLLLVWLVVSALFRKAEYEADAYVTQETHLSSEQSAKRLAITVSQSVLNRPVNGLVPRLLSTHPAPRKRIQAILDE